MVNVNAEILPLPSRTLVASSALQTMERMYTNFRESNTFIMAEIANQSQYVPHTSVVSTAYVKQWNDTMSGIRAIYDTLHDMFIMVDRFETGEAAVLFFRRYSEIVDAMKRDLLKVRDEIGFTDETRMMITFAGIPPEEN